MPIEFKCQDNLEYIKTLDTDSIDFIYFDPPFNGITSHDYDTALDWEPLWTEMWRVLKKPGVIAIHSSQPFTGDLIHSQRKHFKYNWYWDKKCVPTGHLFAKYQPMRHIEEVCIFYKKVRYNPQMVPRETPLTIKGGPNGSPYYHKGTNRETTTYTHRFPTHMLQYKRVEHPYSTRPVSLCEYFINTYSKEGDKVLDLTCSNGQSAIACSKLKRNYIGVDYDPEMIKDAIKNYEKNVGPL